MDGYVLWLQTLCKARLLRVALVFGMMVSVVSVFQTFPISRKAQPPRFPTVTNSILDERITVSSKSMKVGKLSPVGDSQNSTESATLINEIQYGVSNITGETDHAFSVRGDGEVIVIDDDKLDQDGNTSGSLSLDFEGDLLSENIRDHVGDAFIGEQIVDTNNISFSEIVKYLVNDSTVLSNAGGSPTTNTNSVSNIVPSAKIKKIIPPVDMMEMNQLLLRNRAAYHSMRPRWSSVRDKDIITAKAQIENAPVVKNDRELYESLYRNVSTFKRSYQLMEQKLKIYIYKEGQKPIFHQPLLDGIYATEGWFMKLMEANRQYVVKDPRKAHLFYMPFSSRYLQIALYVPNSHTRRNLDQHLRDYVDLLASKYPFWNRTGGADHFLVASHDWAPSTHFMIPLLLQAPSETSRTMRRSLRGLCNADLRLGFQLAKDVSVPQTYIRSARNPLKDLGGNPAYKRPILAFFAGNIHGSLRPILIRHWENKDPDMKIFGPMPGVRSKMSYIQHMKSSKYCICPRGYEVNSPRVVESFFYECVPVLISDNYVPPFFDVLNWDAFSVILPEKDVPQLKEVLESIPEEKYRTLQMGVRKVQQHFLWHSKPVKYDLFHMILHSIWYNRLYQIRTR